MKKGFTLIELLVVVLIIGILAAVALPKYQVAVRKTQLTKAWQQARAIKDAQERYYMANGHYTTDMSALDISIPYVSSSDSGDPENYRAYMLADGTSIQLMLNHGGNQPRLNIHPLWKRGIWNMIAVYYDNNPYRPQARQTCAAFPDNKISMQACLSLGGKPLPYSTGAQEFDLL